MKETTVAGEEDRVPTYHSHICEQAQNYRAVQRVRKVGCVLKREGRQLKEPQQGSHFYWRDKSNLSFNIHTETVSVAVPNEVKQKVRTDTQDNGYNTEANRDWWSRTVTLGTKTCWENRITKCLWRGGTQETGRSGSPEEETWGIDGVTANAPTCAVIAWQQESL